MVRKEQSNIVNLKAWKNQKATISSASAHGWNFRPNDLSDKELGWFYISEPIKNQFLAVAAFEMEYLRDLVAGGNKKIPYSNEELGNAVGPATIEFGAQGCDWGDELLNGLFTGHLWNFSFTETARRVVQPGQEYYNIGAIVYSLEDSTWWSDISIRPMALNGIGGDLRPSDIALASAEYMKADNEKHPEYFEGLEASKLAANFVRKYYGV